MQTITKSLTLLELLTSDIPDGQKATISTDNNLYGTTVIKKDGTIYNKRTAQPMPITSELMASKFKLVNPEQEVAVSDFISAYNDGKKIKIVHDNSYRILHKTEPDELQQLLNNVSLPFGNVAFKSASEAVTMDELTEGKFFIIE